MKKIIFIILSIICLILGLIGLVLPIIPQVPFLVAAVVFGAMGSSRFKDKVKSTKLYQDHVKVHVMKNKYLRKVFGEVDNIENK